MISEETIQFIKNLKDPVMILNPNNKIWEQFKAANPGIEKVMKMEVRYSHFLPVERIVWTDKLNLECKIQGITLTIDDIAPCQQ